MDGSRRIPTCQSHTDVLLYYFFIDLSYATPYNHCRVQQSIIILNDNLIIFSRLYGNIISIYAQQTNGEHNNGIAL